MMPHILEIGRDLAERYNGESGDGLKNVGRKNAYECEDCGAYCITIDRHPGVTPFGVECGECGGQKAYSKFYKVQDDLQPTHEWYRPETLDGIDARYFEHLKKGGLILRPIGGQRWNPPLLHSAVKRLLDEQAAIDSFDKAEAAMMSRQQRRHAERKAGDPPREIQMYGHTYRRVDQ